jgi:hypothetical protein
MVQLQDSILEHVHHHTFWDMFSNEMFEAHCTRILSCFNPSVGIWFTTWPIFLTFRLASIKFSITFHMLLGLPHPSIVGIFQCVCIHRIDLMGIHLLRCIHGNEHIGTHDVICRHCVRCWLSHGMRTITCVSFNHIQFLSLMNWHYAHQRWHSHPSQCCHYRLNVSGFASLILHNLRICYFRLILNNKMSYHNWHPTNQFLPFVIEIFCCLRKHVNVFLHDFANAIWSLKGAKGPHLSTLITFLCQKISITL